MKRRAWLAAGVAAAAGAAGAGFAWWQRRPSAGAVPADFWAQRFETPQGDPLAMETLRGRPLVINFWATWCPPCVKELPEIERFYQSRREQGWQVLGLAIDRAEAVRGFLQQTRVSFPVALAGLGGTELSRGLGNSAGALPFTVLLGPDGRVRERRLGQTSFEELSRWAEARD
ncbi:TlpA disulfide reductase family protein [Caldimonas tepidiphila]|uniref:TlpA disulfide reductase family protein n=1 Tax=Caldimonas tepidiphila TaxID=2315841 RepID=UPI000E5B2CBC|nr:TlpA disulfide reductase family protein [Caldimonas tepidiphila]